MRGVVLLALSAAATGVVTVLPTGVAQADWPAPAGSCQGSFRLQTLDPSDASYMADSPAHKDRNADGWLCFNGHAWKDDTFRH